MRVLVFDTETTGLPASRNVPPSQYQDWPYILQLSYIVYDTDTNAIEQTSDSLVLLPEGETVPPASQAVHGISLSQVRRKGRDPFTVLDEFEASLLDVDYVVAHNLEFDKAVVQAEAYRQGRDNPFIRIGFGLREYCTMMNGRSTCCIWAVRANGAKYIKFPRLSELHAELFNEDASNLHDALADVLVCLRCFLQMFDDSDLMQCDRARYLYKLYRIGSGKKRKLIDAEAYPASTSE